MKKYLVGFLFIFCCGESYSAVEMILTGNNHFGTPRIIAAGINQTSNMSWSLGGGALFSFQIGGHGKREITLEAGAQYLPLRYSSAFTGQNLTYEFPFVRFPINVMVGLNKYLMAGIGFYASVLVSNVNTIFVNGNNTVINSVSPSTLGYGTFDYGFTAQLGLKFAIGQKSNLFFRGLYGIGIANLDSKNGNMLELFDIGIMAGLSFLLK